MGKCGRGRRHRLPGAMVFPDEAEGADPQVRGADHHREEHDQVEEERAIHVHCLGAQIVGSG